MTEADDLALGVEVSKGFVAKLLLAGIGFVGTILFARILGPVSFGGFYLVWTLVQFAILPVGGLEQASKKRFAEADARRGAIVGATGGAVVIIVLAGILTGVLFDEPFTTFTGVPKSGLLFVLLLAPVAFFLPFQGMLSGTGRISTSIWIDALRSFLTTPLQLLFVLLGYGAAGMAYGLSLATALTIPVTHVYLKTRPSIPDMTTIRRLWSYARFSVVSTTLGRAYDRFDVLLLGLVLTPAAVGQYEVAFKLTMPAVLLSEVASEGLLARVTNLDTKGKRVDHDVSNVLAFSGILAVPLFFGALVLSKEVVVTIYGPEYAEAALLLIGLAFYRLLKTQVSPLTQTINGLDRPDLNVRVDIVTLAVNIVLGIALTLRFGMIGVVVATAIAESIRYVALAGIVRRRVQDVSLVPNTFREQILAGIVMAGVVHVLHWYLPVRSWLDLTVLLAVGGTVYGSILLAISDRFRFTLLSILQDAGAFEWVSSDYLRRQR